MDSLDASKIVHSRIQKLESETVTQKIIGYILLQDNGDREMIRLAFGPDNLLHKLIQKAKLHLGLVLKPPVSPPISPSMNPSSIPDFPFQFTPFSQTSPKPSPAPAAMRFPGSYWDPQLAATQQCMNNSDFIPIVSSHLISEDYRFQNQPQFMGLEDQLEPVHPGLSGCPSDCYCLEAALGNLSIRGTRHSRGLSEFPVKVCHYFNKGFCKHGSNCRYLHGQSFPENCHNMFDRNSMEVGNEDQVFLPGTLEKLEFEITELLKSRRGNPVSIASLPMMYYEKYGRTLQAEGYLTESQRHGKAGFSLTRLLARLENSIRVIDRPHGQHSVILVEDVPKYMDSQCERNYPGPIVSGSRQIYLTFPAESTFTEDDVTDYFNGTFGTVEDVRIPCQQKRMFGFVTFVSADTVRMILSKGNPHYIRGSRVLVKPYREKSKLVDRKYCEKLDSPMLYHSHHLDMDCELHASWESSRLLRKQLMEEHEHVLDLERRRLSELQLAQKSLANHSCFQSSMDELKVSEGHSKFPSAKRLGYLLNALNSDSASDYDIHHTDINHSDLERGQGHNLPDSPFASPVADSISTIV
ncbi:unnamed protein product [Ilex paraguariensis]|uniref:Zinc finger CCCH domain-containing protein 18-like n=1 Tax=Ilex paraguariensis TaxID=185542 RepID=A0ABC8SK90_9AQUA